MATCLVILTLLCSLALALPAPRATIIDKKDVGTSYDYVVVGCGVAGLVVSMRLTEDPDVSVLCIEAGPFDDYEELIQFPVYIGQQPYGFYDWTIYTVPQDQLDGQSRHIPMGKGVGGGSLINGMVYSRGNQIDIDAWGALGNDGWSWASLLPYYRRAELYTPKTYPNANPQPVGADGADYGAGGTLPISYPNYFWPQNENWFSALNSLGIPTVGDPNMGLSAGGYFLPSDIYPVNQTRADARRTYYDPFASRSNFNVLAQNQVTRVLFGEGSPVVATGVQYASGPGVAAQTVYANREVIIAAGAVHSPQLLQLSGVGPSGLLQSQGIDVVLDLPGVGSNLQDHPLVHLNYSYQAPGLRTPFSFFTDPAYNAECEQEYLTSKTGPWTARPSTGVAFPSLPQITDNSEELIGAARADSMYYPSTYESTLQAGYEPQWDYILQRLLQDTTPAFEILNNNAGGLDLCLMHPLSRGTVLINSNDPFATPAVDPRWLTNPFDFNMMVTAMQFNQQILNTPEIQELGPTYWTIPENASPAELGGILSTGVGTEYHYSGTCAMLPLASGGVVGPQLIVHGTSNLRVIDTSIFPLIPAAHLQSVAYAVAERAADIIKGII